MDDYIKLHEILGVIDDLTSGLDVGLPFEELDGIACRVMTEITNDGGCQGLESVRSELRDAMITRICEVLEFHVANCEVRLVVSRAQASVAESYLKFPFHRPNFDDEYDLNRLSTLQ